MFQWEQRGLEEEEEEEEEDLVLNLLIKCNISLIHTIGQNNITDLKAIKLNPYSL
jgi:hypothetical protein